MYIILISNIIVDIKLFFLGGNENEWNDWNVVQTNTKYKQQNYTIGQNKLLGLKVIY